MSHKDDTKKYRHLNEIDILATLHITDCAGNKLTKNNLNPLIGYRIVHRSTEFLLPHTRWYEIMGVDYALRKMAGIVTEYLERNIDFPFSEYELIPIYLNEIESSDCYILLYSDKDTEKFGLFT